MAKSFDETIKNFEETIKKLGFDIYKNLDEELMFRDLKASCIRWRHINSVMRPSREDLLVILKEDSSMVLGYFDGNNFVDNQNNIINGRFWSYLSDIYHTVERNL